MINVIRLYKSGLFVAALVAVSLSAQADVTLVEDGAPRATIVLAEKPTKSAQLAAFELQYVIGKITGATLPIAREPYAPTNLTVYVGASKGTAALGLGELEPERYVVRFAKDAIILAGHDSPEFGAVNYGQSSTFPKLRGACHATTYAAYDFLEKSCGVRFYRPGDLGLCYKARKTLFVAPFAVDRTPYMSGMRYLSESAPWGKKHHATPYERDLFHFRLRQCEFWGQADHNMHGLYFRYWKQKKPGPYGYVPCFKEHIPSLFAKGYEGKYSGELPSVYPGDPDIPPQPCFSNPETVRRLADLAQNVANGTNEMWMSGHAKVPGIPYTVPMLDNDNSKYCACADCLRLVPEGVSEADRGTWIYFGFINALCRELAKRDPGLNVAAGVYQRPMADVPLEKNMALQLMLGVGSWYNPVTKARHLKILDYWAKKAKKDGDRPLSAWVYLLSPWWDLWMNNNPIKCFPGFYPHGVVEAVRETGDRGVRAWFAESFVDYSWLEGYFAMQVCFDRDYPAEREIDAFFDNYFGAAAKPMREYWKTVEDAYWNPKNYPETFITKYPSLMPILALWCHNDDINWGIGTRERVEKLDRLFKEAQGLAQTDMEKARLKFLDDTVHAQMLAGLKDHEKRASIRAVPPARVYVGPATTAVVRVAKTLMNEVRTNGCTFALSHDRTTLRLDYTEDVPLGLDQETVDAEWKDNVEIFFAAKREMPYHHFVLGRNGKAYTYQHLDQNGVMRVAETDMGAKVVRSSVGADGRWSFTLEFPIAKLLPGKTTTSDHRLIFANFYRTRPNGENLCWTPVFQAGYLAGIDRLGYLCLGGPASADIDVYGDFKDSTSNHLNEKGWSFWSPVKNDPRLKQVAGEGMTIKGGGEGCGFILTSRPLFTLAVGDEVVVRYRASGEKSTLMCLDYYGVTPWDDKPEIYAESIGGQRQAFPLTSEMKDGELRFKVKPLEKALVNKDYPGADITKARVRLWVAKDATFKIEKLSVRRIAGNEVK